MEGCVYDSETDDCAGAGEDTGAGGMSEFSKPKHCAPGYAEFYNGLIPLTIKGTCHKLTSSTDTGTHAAHLRDIEHALSNGATGGSGLAELLNDMFTLMSNGEGEASAGAANVFTCSSLNGDGAMSVSSGNPREIRMGMTTSYLAPKWLSVGFVGFYDQDDDPVENGQLVSKYYKVGIQNFYNAFGLSVDYEVDQTKLSRPWTGTHKKSEGERNSEWRAAIGSGPVNYPDAGQSLTQLQYVETQMMFFIESFYSRTVYTRKPSQASVLNALGGAFALALAAISFFFKDKVVHLEGQNAKVKVMRFQNRGEARKEAKQFMKSFMMLGAAGDDIDHAAVKSTMVQRGSVHGNADDKAHLKAKQAKAEAKKADEAADRALARAEAADKEDGNSRAAVTPTDTTVVVKQ